MDYITNYIAPELLVLVPVLYILGAGIKSSQTIKDKYIPAIVGMVAVLLACAYIFATSALDGWQSILMAAFTAATQGILCAGASVYVNQLVKQAGKDE